MHRFAFACRLAATLVLILLTVYAASAVADDHPHGAPPWRFKHHHKDDDTPPSTAAPATTSAPPAPAAAPAPPLPAAAPTAPPAPAPPAPAPPVLGQSVALAPVSGTVLVRAPGAAPGALSATTGPLPTGSRIDARAGEVALTTALDAAGATQTGSFHGGVFEVRQAASGKGLTRIVLIGGHWAACGARAHGARAHAASKKRKPKKPVRSLWGSDDHGRFQTQGSGSVATVRGTRWLTEDFCDGTRTTVVAGAVAVRSRRTGKTTIVGAGHSLLVAR